MTVADVAVKVTYASSGTATIWPFTFLLADEDHLRVFITDPNGAETEVSPALYSVTGVDDASGGSITYPLTGEPLASGYSITLYRDVPLDQAVALVNQGPFYPAVIERALDRSTMRDQLLNERLARSLKIPVSDDPDISLELPSSASRKSRVLGWDYTGKNIEMLEPSSASLSDFSAAYVGVDGFPSIVQGKNIWRDRVPVDFFGIRPENSDNTDLWNDVGESLSLVQNTTLADRAEVYFPQVGTGVYTGEFKTTRSLTIDGRDVQLRPASGTGSIFSFEGSVGSEVTVTNSPMPTYGDRVIQIADTLGWAAGDIAVMYDESYRSTAVDPLDPDEWINRELIRVDTVLSGTELLVEDMIRSTMTTGTVRLYRITPVVEPKIKNLRVYSEVGHDGPMIRFWRTIGARWENIRVENSVGHGVRWEESYDGRGSNIYVGDPRSVTSGQGYGQTALYSRVLSVMGLTGIRLRHVFDSNSSYDVSIRHIRSLSDAGTATLIASHNGFGGLHRFEDVVVKSPATVLAVSGSVYTGTNADAQVHRDLTVRDVRHAVKTGNLLSAQTNTIDIGHDCFSVELANIHQYHSDFTTALSSASNTTVRIDGNIWGRVSVDGASLNRGLAVFMHARRSTGAVGPQGQVHLNRLHGVDTRKVAYLRGTEYGTVTKISGKVSENLLQIDQRFSIASIVLSCSDDWVLDPASVGDAVGTSALGTAPRGKPPLLHTLAATNLTLAAGFTITLNDLMLRGSQCLLTCAGAVTSDTTTSIASAIWQGQEFDLYNVSVNNITFKNASNFGQLSGADFVLLPGAYMRIKWRATSWRLMYASV